MLSNIIQPAIKYRNDLTAVLPKAIIADINNCLLNCTKGMPKVHLDRYRILMLSYSKISTHSMSTYKLN